ncbi:lytic murein transglycosylase B [Ferrimonas balearica]|uniref:lytic murein transglycosylase B n=1 Tax=Ferrimonas balearica TaxID=44012 RepID=UPI001F1F97F5|nr:lytic murein transglycosylase B [Ferrimonas balearica]MBY6018024.1 lytic murein transglycosylase B [Halomonas denitrificans]MBY6094362.1 lytic murein transglycosylase B [Ferrimonas balearica]
MIGRSLLAAALWCGSAMALANPQADFVAEWQQQGLSKAYLEQALDQAELSQDVLDAIQKPWEAKPWYQYYPLFLTEERLQAGLAFWNEHQDTLARAEQTFGVEPEIIVAIIGVETYYGRHLGRHKVLDALYTLGFHYPPRQTFFRKEFGHYLKLAQEQGWALDSIKGSYAGAMGYGQFIPSSYLAYAVDFDNDGKRDLIGNPVDAIGSVANYFAEHRWQHGQIAIEPVTVAADANLDGVMWDGKRLSQDAAALKARGVAVPDGAKGPFSVVELEVAENQHDTFLAHPNFYSITRYNRSPLYAMAVWQFSQQLKQAKAND